MSKPNLEFGGRVALIAGGTSGIGAATARRLAELGANVVVTGRRRREGQLLVGKIKRNGGCAAFFPADLSQPQQVRLIVPFTLEKTECPSRLTVLLPTGRTAQTDLDSPPV